MNEIVNMYVDNCLPRPNCYGDNRHTFYSLTNSDNDGLKF